jgi:anti-sigma-K factor RskA
VDIKEYINSGVLDLYVFGSLSPEEKRDVERNASLYPEIKAELDNIESTMNAFARKHAVPPGSDLKSKIWNAIQESEEEQPAKVISFNSNFTKYLAAASIILFVISTTFAVLFANKYKEASDEITALEKQNLQLAQQYANANTLYQKTSFHMNFVNDPHTMKVMMSGTPAHPGMEAKVYWNKETKQAMVAIDTLPMNPQGMQYELWAISDKGTPIAEGVFDAGTKDMLLMKQVDHATAFAVTLEKRGGVDSPTMSQMYVMGKVNS